MFRVYGLELTLPIVVVQFDYGPNAPLASRVGHYYFVTGVYCGGLGAQDKPKDYLGNVPRKKQLASTRLFSSFSLKLPGWAFNTPKFSLTQIWVEDLWM